MYHLAESIRIMGVLLRPFMPETAAKIFEQLGLSEQDWESASVFGGIEDGHKVGTPSPLFARIDKEKLLAELMGTEE